MAAGRSQSEAGLFEETFISWPHPEQPALIETLLTTIFVSLMFAPLSQTLCYNCPFIAYLPVPVARLQSVLLPASGSESQTPDLRQSGSGSRDPGQGGEGEVRVFRTRERDLAGQGAWARLLALMMY